MYRPSRLTSNVQGASFFLALFVFLIFSSLSVTDSNSGVWQKAKDKDSVAGEVIVKLKAGASETDVNELEQDTDSDINKELSKTDSGSIRRIHSRSKSTDVLISQLQRNPKVAYVEPNYILQADIIPNDPNFGQLYGLLNTGQTIGSSVGIAGADIEAEPAWNFTQGSETIVVGVVDTGIDYRHPDLAANVWSNPGGIGGCAAGTHGFNAITGTCDPLDDNNHGTHCSGTIGAVGNNGVGVVGVNWNVQIMGLKFLSGGGSGTTADAIEAIDFAINAKIAGVNLRVLSNSWGGGGFSQALLDVINKANANDILFVAAAGNSGFNNDISPHYPSSYIAPNMVAVAATTNRDGLASFSNFGLNSVHLGAPGVNILSTTPNNTYSFFSGTSMATPHVAGAAALILSASPLTTAELKTTILSTTDPLSSLSGKTVTGGRLNVCKAIPGCSAPATPDYTLSVSPASQSVPPTGGSPSYTVTITRTGGHSLSVSLSVTGLPAGASGSFDPNPTTGNSSTMTVTVPSGTASGSYPLSISGTDGVLTRTATATLVVQAAAPPNFSLSVSPTSQTVPKAGGSPSYTVTITRTGGFSSAVTLSTSGLPNGATGSFTPNNTTGNSSTLTLTVRSSTVHGTYPFTISGTGGGLTRTTSATLVKAKK